MLERIIIAGAGGQGIMLMGKVLAEAAMREEKHITWFPSYGAEVRGGTAHCMVVISDSPIGSPYIREADTLIVLNKISWEKFSPLLKAKGLAIINSSFFQEEPLKKKPNLIAYPYTQIAVDLGNIRVANMIMLGTYLAAKKTLSLETYFKVMQDFAPKGREDIFEINKKALCKGVDLYHGKS